MELQSSHSELEDMHARNGELLQEIARTEERLGCTKTTNERK
jgi:hypothetical protein